MIRVCIDYGLVFIQKTELRKYKQRKKYVSLVTLKCIIQIVEQIKQSTVKLLFNRAEFQIAALEMR